MKHSVGRAGRQARLGVLLVALVASPGLAACAATNAVTTAKTYAAGDGFSGEIADPASGTSVQLRNMLVVGEKKGGPGTLLGAVVNNGAKPIDVSLTVLDATGQAQLGTGTVTVAPGQLVKVGPGEKSSVSISALPVDAGAVIQLKAGTPAGSDQLSVPVMAPTGTYAGIKP